jgi:hypothetical protein
VVTAVRERGRERKREREREKTSIIVVHYCLKPKRERERERERENTKINLFSALVRSLPPPLSHHGEGENKMAQPLPFNFKGPFFGQKGYTHKDFFFSRRSAIFHTDLAE